MSEKSETVSSPTRDPAAPWSVPTARSWPAVQGFAVLVALPPEPPVGEGGVVEPAWPVPVDPPVVVVVAGPPLVDPHAVSAAAATSTASATPPRRVAEGVPAVGRSDAFTMPKR